MNEPASPDERPWRSPAVERCIDEEVLEWYRMSPQERWDESMRLWDTFFLLGGRLDPEPASQSPFHVASAWDRVPADGRSSLRSVRRSGV